MKFNGNDVRKVLESKGLDVFSARKKTVSSGAHSWWGARGTFHREAGRKTTFISVELLSNPETWEDDYLEAWVALEDAGYKTSYSERKGLRVYPKF
jgi:hypothetical protein